MKYIVTGGAGFIGSHVVDLLIKEGYTVHIVDIFLHKKRQYFINPKAKFHKVDIRDLNKLKKIFKGADGVFHLAAQPRMQYSIEEPLLTNNINITGTLNVLLAAKDVGVNRVIYSASSSAYGEGHPMPLKETMEARPIIPYAIQKRVGEQYCEAISKFYDLETVCLRYFNVYGPRQTTEKDGPYATVIGVFIGQSKKGLPLTIVPNGKQKRDYTHVLDVARANILAMKSKKVGKGEIINIGTGKNYSILEIADLVGGERVFIEPRVGEVRETLADNSKAKKLIGWSPKISFEKGIRDLKDNS
jgi:nucleoside-diphosphate-sugar epimerase